MPPRATKRRHPALPSPILLSPQSPTLPGLAPELRQRLLALAAVEGGIPAVFQLARTCRAMMAAFDGMPWWRKAAERNGWKHRSRKAEPPDAGFVLAKLRAKGKHLCLRLDCLLATDLPFFVATARRVRERLCAACLAQLWDRSAWVRERSLASEEWTRARYGRMNRTAVARIGLPKAVFEGLPFRTVERGHGYGYGRRTANVHLYNRREVLMAQWQCHGGVDGAAAMAECRLDKRRVNLRKAVDKQLKRYSGIISAEITWPGTDRAIDNLRADAVLADVAHDICIPLVEKAVREVLNPADLRFPEAGRRGHVNFRDFDEWFPKEKLLAEARKERDSRAWEVMERHAAEAEGAEFDLRRYLVKELGHGRVPSDAEVEKAVAAAPATKVSLPGL
ncbi:hypothetical protein DFJ74DRAFT_742057 [Hyaloraphidium curvatum]|nr:hypothetical protein DFJ74DRAFT_742057 [Hyaloraphidium curvatum]